MSPGTVTCLVLLSLFVGLLIGQQHGRVVERQEARRQRNSLANVIDLAERRNAG